MASGEVARPATRSWSHGALTAASVVVLTIVQLVRVAGAPTVTTVWAEDGSVFLTGALRHASLFSTQGGYLNLVPRVLARASTVLAIDDAAAWFAIVAALVTALLAVTVFHLADFLVESPWLRAVLTLSFVLPPILVFESMANIANLQWPFLAALFWALIRPVSARWDVAACSVIVVAAALSSSVALLFLPLAALVVVLRRADRRAWVVPALFGVACLGQLVAVLATSAPASRGTVSLGVIPKLYAVSVVGELVLGHRVVDETWLGPGLWVFVLLAVALAVALGLLWRRCDGDGRRWGGVAIVMSVVVFCGTAYWRGGSQITLVEGMQTGSGARYVGIGLQLLVAGAVILVARARLPASWRRALVVLLVAQALLVPASAFRLTTNRSGGPRWGVALGQARRACLDEPGGTVELVPVTPRHFVAAIACRELR